MRTRLARCKGRAHSSRDTWICPAWVLPARSAHPSAADMRQLHRHVRFVPLSDSTDDLFDHFTGGGQKRVWHGETERLRGLEIYHQLILKWLLHWQISRFLTL
jgi:hypothetical protein